MPVEAEELSGGLAGGFEFTREESGGREARLGLVLGDGAQTRQRDAARFGREYRGAALGEALDRVEAFGDAWRVEEVDELVEGDRAQVGDGGEVHLPLEEEIEDLGLGLAVELFAARLHAVELGLQHHGSHVAGRRSGCKGKWAEGRACARAEKRWGGGGGCSVSEGSGRTPSACLRQAPPRRRIGGRSRQNRAGRGRTSPGGEAQRRLIHLGASRHPSKHALPRRLGQGVAPACG